MDMIDIRVISVYLGVEFIAQYDDSDVGSGRSYQSKKRCRTHRRSEVR
jgi:hypothetical protein